MTKAQLFKQLLLENQNLEVIRNIIIVTALDKKCDLEFRPYPHKNHIEIYFSFGNYIYYSYEIDSYGGGCLLTFIERYSQTTGSSKRGFGTQYEFTLRLKNKIKGYDENLLKELLIEYILENND